MGWSSKRGWLPRLPTWMLKQLTQPVAVSERLLLCGTDRFKGSHKEIDQLLIFEMVTSMSILSRDPNL